MKVNNTSTVNVSHQEAVEALKAAGGTVTLVTACFYLSTINNDSVSNKCCYVCSQFEILRKCFESSQGV